MTNKEGSEGPNKKNFCYNQKCDLSTRDILLAAASLCGYLKEVKDKKNDVVVE